MEENELYRGPKYCKKYRVSQRHRKERSKQSKDTNKNKQSHGPSTHMNKRYYDMDKRVFYQN